MTPVKADNSELQISGLGTAQLPNWTSTWSIQYFEIQLSFHQLKMQLHMVISHSKILNMWRKALLLKYIGLPIPLLKKKSKFNFSQTIGEMVFVSFEVEKMRMFLVQSVVRWYCVLVRSWGGVVSFPMWNHWLKDGFN